MLLFLTAFCQYPVVVLQAAVYPSPVYTMAQLNTREALLLLRRC